MKLEDDKIEKVPDVFGVGGQAWKCPHEADGKAGVAVWLIEAPWAHPIWHSYMLVLVHLRPLPGGPPPNFYLEGATHELWLHAIDPSVERQTILSTGKATRKLLWPMNFAAQIIEPTDELARERVEGAVRKVCAGQLSPDTDFRRDWEALFGSNMLKPEYRS